VAILAQPFIPAGAAKLLDLLAIALDARDFAHVGEKGRLKPGTPLPAPSGIFPRYVEAEEGKA
ncbi:MAG TPA: methionine--tRNA ligase, partial [Xanthobacteraceae bacterium]|nr:methionine--tRNA ligase [Xanthobacteraceae bacterium]